MGKYIERANKMKSPLKFIKVAQSVSTMVYRYYGDGACRKVTVSHRNVPPIIFRTLGRKFDFSQKI